MKLPNITLNHILYISIIFSAIISSSLVITWQYFTLKNQYKKITFQTLNFAHDQWNSSIHTYNSIFSLINKKLLEHNNKDIHLTLKHFYVNKDKQSNLAPGFNNILWQDKYGNVTDRYGVIPKGQLSYKLSNNIVSNDLHLYHITQNTSFNTPVLILVKTVFDNNNKSLGNILILLDFHYWIGTIYNKCADHGCHISLTKFNNKKPLLNKSHINTSNHINDNMNLLFIRFQNLGTHPYHLLIGYDNALFYKKLIVNSIPLLTIIWICSIIFCVIQIIFSSLLKSEIKKNFNQRISGLSTDKAKLLKAQAQANFDIRTHNLKYQEIYENYNNLITTSRISINAKDKLVSEFANRIVETIIEIRETLRILQDAAENNINVKLTNIKKHALLSSLDDKLSYLAIFCVGKKKNVQINMHNIITDVTKTYEAKLNELDIKIESSISSKTSSINYDPTLLKQILVNLLYESISGSRPKGLIKISVNKRTKNNRPTLILKIQDNGFGISEETLDHENIYPKSFFSLGLNALQVIAQSLNGSLDITCTTGIGKTITLILPYKNLAKSKKPFTPLGNVIQFQKI